MKNKLCLLIICIFTISAYTCKAQQFLNGDLEGVASGVSVLPPNWQNVPFDDINCQAANIGWDTPVNRSVPLRLIKPASCRTILNSTNNLSLKKMPTAYQINEQDKLHFVTGKYENRQYQRILCYLPEF